MTDSTQRFSDRVADYIKYRPSYPQATIDAMLEHCKLGTDAIIADVGSGTGILTRLLLSKGCNVQGIEPNDAMRRAAENDLGDHPGFVSINGTAEATQLDAHSVDLIVAGQAFHWFDAVKARTEFQRIIKPDGFVALLWNGRLTDTTPFLVAYEALLQEHATDYKTVNHMNIDDQEISRFFAPGSFTVDARPNRQAFDFAGLKGRLLSSSYAPNIQHAGYGPMLDELKAIFTEHQRNGKVQFEYQTTMYIGRFKA